MEAVEESSQSVPEVLPSHVTPVEAVAEVPLEVVEVSSESIPEVPAQVKPVEAVAAGYTWRQWWRSHRRRYRRSQLR